MFPKNVTLAELFTKISQEKAVEADTGLLSQDLLWNVSHGNKGYVSEN